MFHYQLIAKHDRPDKPRRHRTMRHDLEPEPVLGITPVVGPLPAMVVRVRPGR